MNLAPDISMLEALRSQHRMKWPILLGELIDNAINASARTISMDFTASRGIYSVVFSDDGVGCEDLSRFLVIGRRQDHKGRKGDMGRYGIGAKDAMLMIGRAVRIRSTHRGVTRSVIVDWDKMLEDQSWDVDDPETVSIPGAKGTELQIMKAKKPPEACVLDRLGETYAPAITAGVQLQYRLGEKKPWQVIRPLGKPQLRDAKSKVWQVSTGKDLRIEMGIITQPSERPLQGIHIVLEGYRVISSKTRIGLGDAPTPGLYGVVELSGKGWKVAKNKNDLAEPDVELLSACISEEFADIIAKSRREGEQVDLREINAALGESFQSLKRKARRDPPTVRVGAILPKFSGAKHSRAAKTQAGDTFEESRMIPGSAGGPTICVEDSGPNSPLFRIEGDSTIFINSVHPTASQFGSDINALAMPALVYFAADAVIREKKRWLPFAEIEAESSELLMEAVSRYLAAYTTARAHDDARQAG